jgi:hypothetical protein
MCHRTALKEGEWANSLCPVDDLVRHDKVSRLDLLLQTAHGGEGDDGAHADGSQRGNVRPRRNFMGSDVVVGAVTAQKGDGDIFAAGRALVVEDGDGRGGFAPGGGDVERSDLGKTREFLQTGTADDCDPDLVCIQRPCQYCTDERSGVSVQSRRQLS